MEAVINISMRTRTMRNISRTIPKKLMGVEYIGGCRLHKEITGEYTGSMARYYLGICQGR